MGRNNKDFKGGHSPSIKDIDAAWFSGKITRDEANDLAKGSKEYGSSGASDFATEHNEYHTHKRAGLN